MANNYNIMADYIVSKYVERVSGKDLPDIFVEDDPAERVMVGMLAEDRIDTTFQGGYTENSSTKFESVPSISFSFVVHHGYLNVPWYQSYSVCYCCRHKIPP